MAIHETCSAQSTVCLPGMAGVTAKNKQKLLKWNSSEAAWWNTVHAVAKYKMSWGVVLLSHFVKGGKKCLPFVFSLWSITDFWGPIYCVLWMPELPSVEKLSGAQSEHQMQHWQDDLLRWSEASSISLLSGILSCHPSMILWVWFIYNFFFLRTPELCSNPEILLVFPKSYFPFLIYIYLGFAGLTLISSQLSFWILLLWRINMLLIFLSPKSYETQLLW